MTGRKLIEVALPLEAINLEAERDGPKRKNHPWRLHYWWARRKLATARAVLFAQLVDDPSARPDEFPTEELQRKERDRLHRLIARLVAWDNVTDSELFADARAEVLKSTGGNPPPILDPFAGGGTIPLEAQRLGLEARASDLNPVAVLINKALIEIPPRFKDQEPVFPGLASSEFRAWSGAEGLAADVRAYGNWIKTRAHERLSHLYPNSNEGNAIAWVWARTVVCPNPGCGADVPLISSLNLSVRKGREFWLRPVVNGKHVTFEIEAGPRRMESNKRGQGAKFDCWVCGSAISPKQVHDQIDVKVKPPSRLLAVITMRNSRREFSKPTPADVRAAEAAAEEAARIRADDVSLNAESRGTFGGNAQGKRYGFFAFADYFTDRQLASLVTFSDLVGEARRQVIADGGDEAYADAVATYLGLSVSRGADYQSNVTTWHYQNEQIRNVFARQAISMAWDYLEVNPLGDGSGTWASQYELAAQALEGLTSFTPGFAEQRPAQEADFHGSLLSTDPPYYDNVSYSDLSDFFYVWLRRTLRNVHPKLLATMLVPKAEELVANAYRHNGREGAKRFFEEGFRTVFGQARQSALGSFPITVYYAFKQSETSALGEASTGWETLLEGMVGEGWEVTSTWPFRTETASRLIAQGTNALASSIVLSLRPRPADAPTTDRRGFIQALESELPDALRKLQQGRIAPVDLPQAAIGPGMAVFSRYSAVLEPDGQKMVVRSALSRINEVLDQVLNEQEGEFDPVTRFAIAWYRQHGYDSGKFGDADNLARARNTSVETMDREGILTSRAGSVQLITPVDLPTDYDVLADVQPSSWEILHHLIRTLEQDGIERAGALLKAAMSRPDGRVDTDLLKELGHLLFRIAEGRGWTKDALSFNQLVTSWPEILDITNAEQLNATKSQGVFAFEDED